MESWVGKRLGKVQIESLVGRGGVAEVYLGTHTTLGRKVAVKILRNLDDESSDSLERFEREARVVAKLRHPYIVQVYDFDTIDNSPYLVMEYIQGPSLSKYLNALHQNKGRLPLPQAARLLYAVASALQYAHNNGIVHRDVKPGNILLTSPSARVEIGKPLPDDFEPVLTDFGLVRFMGAHRQTTTGHIAGTPAYMSPEQARGEAADGRTDVYSLGIVLYEMLAGDVPFDGESTVSILLKQVAQPPPPIPGLSPQIRNVLDRALAKDVKDRFQTPMELADAFGAAVGLKNNLSTIKFDASPAPLPPVKEEEPAKIERPANLRGQWIRIAVLAVIAIALGVFFFINNGIPSSASKGVTSTGTPSATDTSLPAASANPGTATAVLPSGPIGFLHFQNRSAVADQVSLTAQGMPAPPSGSHYEVWLTGANQPLSLGIFVPDQDGKVGLTFASSDGTNLLSRYDGLEVTIEPDGDVDPKPSGLIVYSFALPQDGLPHVRYLLSAFSKTPDKSALIQGLYASVKQIDDLAKEMQSASESGDQKAIQQKAETALNILVGSQSADFKDWNGDGKIEPRQSYGLLLNGSEYGYLQAVQVETGYLIANIPNTAEYNYLTTNGKVTKACTQNMSLGAPALRNLLLAILNPASDASSAESIRQVAALSDQMLNGADTDKNGKIDILSGECGAEAAYAYGYHMADMPILPAGLSDQLTQVAGSPIPATVAGNNSGNTPDATSAVNTPQSDPTKEPKATKPPKATKDPSGNNGGGNNGGGNNGGGNNGGGNGGGGGKPKKTPKK